MPNQPKTPNRAIRIPDEIWEAAQARAREEQTNVSAVINAFLREWTGHAEDKTPSVDHADHAAR